MSLKRLDRFVWEIPKQNDMLVPARIYSSEEMIQELIREESTDWSTLRQLRNVACLPGIQKHALALADCHPGYGAPIGGVAAMDTNEGVITFGLIGFDINCGVRTLKTPLKKQDIEGVKEKLADALFENIPAGLGSEGELRLSPSQIDEVLIGGAEYVVKQGYGLKEDLEYIELNGKAPNAKPENVSQRAKQRQYRQVGTLGSGNHYLEVQYVEEIYDEEAAKAFGLFKDQILVSIHCGSRALGHQIGMDYIQVLRSATRKYGIRIKDNELVCAPIQSEEGQRYLSAVNAGINCAFANRQVLTHLTRNVFANVLGIDEKEVKTLYDVGHNTAKIEKHSIDGITKEVLVHRKGSTRGFGPGREEIPEEYRSAGQPVLVGGTMGTASYILVGTEKGMQECFGSAVHGAGRKMSRHAAVKRFRGEQIAAELRKKGIIIKAHSWRGAAEEAPQAYKDIDVVVNVMHESGINKKVARLRPLITVKG